MITVAVIGILARIAYPSYQSYIAKASRRSAQAQMMELASRQQQFMLSQRTYVPYSTITTAGYALPRELNGLYTPSITVGAGTVPAYTITFTATGRQASDGNLDLNSEGVRSPADKW